MSVLSSSADSETCSRMISTQLYDANDHNSSASNASINIGSCVTSATQLATKATESEDWARSIKLDPVIKTAVPDAAEFNPIRDIQAAARTIPIWLKNPDSPEFGYVFPVLLEWKDILCSTLQQSGSRYSPSHSKDLDFPQAVQVILRACYHQEVVLKKLGLPSERSTRAYIDGLMDRSCEAVDDLVWYSTDRMLRLPVSTSKLDRIRVSTIATSGGIFLPVPNFRPYELSPEFRTAASALADLTETSKFMFIHCVTQYKSMNSSENRMKMAMASALQQKKALGLQDQFVFGVFQFDSDFLQVNAGRWVDDEIKIYKIGAYTLRSPASLVEFQLVVRRINQLAPVYRDQLMEVAPELQRAIENKAPVDGWAPIRIATTYDDFERLSESEHLEESTDPEYSGTESNMKQGGIISFAEAGRYLTGLFPELSSLGEWDVNERINTFRQGIRSCEFGATEDAKVS
ncbi:hypothetical protein RSOLAG22IIIB_03978 [Rhizoctonia solani]|uniref:Uncharacterized protein n=1 Tax=Rhizoctonia solani TaxID=456999 RepID=A0A0K6FU91_9AGAM|nr:hypothetical protein RSOLAG22IIIB_03978 [Rhizoctonia solani]